MKRARLAPVSARRRREQRVYTTLRAKFLDANPICEFPAGCREWATEVHHMAGRVGAAYLDVSRWMPICSACHRYVTENPAWAIANGASESRLSIGRTCDNEGGSEGAINTARSLTHLLDSTERGLAVEATRSCGPA